MTEIKKANPSSDELYRRGSEVNQNNLITNRTKVFQARGKNCPLSIEGAPKIDYKDAEMLKKYISERGKIIPRRITSISAKMQRKLAKAIKRARIIALLPFIDNS